MHWDRSSPRDTAAFLVNPPLGGTYGFKRGISSVLPALGLLTIAGFLKDRGVSVRVFDLEFSEDENLLWRQLRSHSRPFVGITLRTSDFPSAAAIAARAVAENPECLIVGGGPHVNKHTWRSVLRNSHFDVLVFGDGELVTWDLFSAYDRYGRACLPRLERLGNRAIAWQDSHDVHFRPGWNVIRDLDSLPHPDLGGVPWSRYRPSIHRDIGRYRKIKTGHCRSIACSVPRSSRLSIAHTMSNGAHQYGYPLQPNRS